MGSDQAIPHRQITNGLNCMLVKQYNPPFSDYEETDGPISVGAIGSDANRDINWYLMYLAKSLTKRSKKLEMGQ